jgi:hypothetical protein
MARNSRGDSDPYDIQIYYDHLFGTIVPIPTGSPALQGISSESGLSPGILAPADEEMHYPDRSFDCCATNENWRSPDGAV